MALDASCGVTASAGNTPLAALSVCMELRGISREALLAAVLFTVEGAFPCGTGSLLRGQVQWGQWALRQGSRLWPQVQAGSQGLFS